MGPQRASIYVEISPTRRQLAVFRGAEVVDSRCERSDALPTGDAQPGSPQAHRRWSESLDAFQATLAGWVREMGLRGARVNVVYTSPDTSASTHACPLSAGRAMARHAAALALADGLSYPMESATSDVVELFADREQGVTADGSARPPQVHHLTASDSDLSAAAVHACVENAGLRVAAMSPAAGATLLAASSLAERLARENHPTPGSAHPVVLAAWIGEHGSALAAVSATRLAFTRSISLGVELMAEAMVRASAAGVLRAGPGVDAPVAMDMAGARTILAGGVSRAENDETVTLPQVRPVLQKLCIEAKQSIRFGLTQEERGGALLVVAGPGAHVPGLARILANETGLTLLTTGEEDVLPDALRGDTAAALGAATWVNLLPTSLKAAARLGTMRRALRVGVAAALLAVAVDAGITSVSLRRGRETLSRLEAMAASPDPARDSAAKLAAAKLAVMEARMRIDRALGREPDAAAVLSMLADAVPETIHLNGIELGRDQAAWSTRVTGVVRAGEGEAASKVVRELVDRLGGVPIVAQARLGPTELSKIDGEDALSFDISLRLVGVPRGGVQTSDASDAAEQTGGRP